MWIILLMCQFAFMHRIIFFNLSSLNGYWLLLSIRDICTDGWECIYLWSYFILFTFHYIYFSAQTESSWMFLDVWTGCLRVLLLNFAVADISFPLWNSHSLQFKCMLWRPMFLWKFKPIQPRASNRKIAIKGVHKKKSTSIIWSCQKKGLQTDVCAINFISTHQSNKPQKFFYNRLKRKFPISSIQFSYIASASPTLLCSKESTILDNCRLQFTCHLQISFRVFNVVLSRKQKKISEEEKRSKWKLLDCPFPFLVYASLCIYTISSKVIMR